MKIQSMDGNLANQIRQYIFVRYAQRKKPHEKWFIDDSAFFVRDCHTEIELASEFKKVMILRYEVQTVFEIKLNRLSEFYEKTIWNEIVRQRRKGIGIYQTLFDMGKDIVLFEGRVNEKQATNQAHFSGAIIKPESEHLGFHPEYIDFPYENIYYHAEWASRKWFDAYAEENRRELQFPALTDEQNLDYAEQIQNSYSVGIHIRRGDFQNVGWDLPAEAYKPPCQGTVEEHPDAHFFIFSDDLVWCQVHEKELGLDLARQTTYVSGNTGAKSYIDMQLLSMCKGIIRNAESSFSQVAGWLDKDLEFEIKIKPEAGYPYKVVTM